MVDNLSAYKSSSQSVLVGLLAFDECTINAIAVQVPRTKLGFGADGVYSEVASDNPFPVYLASAGTLPTGAATSALQTSGNASLTSIDGKITAVNTGAVVLAAGTAAFGKLAANDGVDIGDVTINNASLAVTGTFWQATQPVSLASVPSHAVTQSGTWNVGTLSTITNVVHIDDNAGSITVDGSVSVSGIVAGVTATSLGKAEDAAAADGDTGVAVWAVRKDTAATTVGTDGDYHPFEVDGNGRLWVNGSSVTQPVSGTVTANAGTGSFTVAQATAASLNATVVGTGTFAVQATLASETTKVIGTVNVSAGQTIAAVTTVSTVTNLSQLGGNAIAMGTGTRSAGTQRVTIATDDVVPASQSGTWNITNVSGTISLPTGAATESTLSTLNGKVTACNTGAVVVSSQPARAATTDTITAKLATDAIQNGTTALTPKFAKIAASSSGDNTIVAAVTSKKIRVLQYLLIGNGAVNAKFQSGAAGTDLTGLHYIAAAGGGASAPFSPVGLFETASGVLLNLNLSGAVAVGGWVSYLEV